MATRAGPAVLVPVALTLVAEHHDRNDRRGVNLGTVLVIWDVLAGLADFTARRAAPLTAQPAPATRPTATPRVTPVATGLAGHPVPVEQELVKGGAVGLLRNMGRQLASPMTEGRHGANGNRVGGSVQWGNGWRHRWQAAGETWWHPGWWRRQPS